MATVGVLLSGCGVFDGTEIHEAVITLLALDRAGAEIRCMAPNTEQYHVINHLTQEVTDEKRNVLVESARIARGEIQDIRDVSAGDIDALIIPGGFGAAKNLSDFAVKGPDATVHPEVKRLIRDMVEARKPIGAICIAPATLTRALSDRNPEVTIGSDEATASAIETMGGKHKTCAVDMIHVDEGNNLVTTPAYMLGPGIKDVAVGIERLVSKVLEKIG
ncbi:MAG: isoprenoid biosynthesis glyoxalase ElbB [Deltaproteobacteria bacterium]|nr:isoprenoid biosynthesis glyoxalase ElbB [Deltaproteobacteria bacterium]MBW1949568.1 isoprenoid biosynthesis glyoxalase ElbB [Deltaproteobacteria bacterium]MBW2009145.1 isoprenoid biosynthesis glyoxalase ElbB [Deltaproteobacteria bacterium]MBW2102764.1 isoprenoid biosynthesis glyoxalase ElbB [Deltaproteobacteria bacterium]MBW2348792.1 isoprenoid biosynthesis glyoxalase ElbB [Deltaproteobacteria bacterium]